MTMGGIYKPNIPADPGAGDNGETWDPSGGPEGKGAWIPRGQGPAQASRPIGEYGNTPTDPRGNPLYSNAEAPTQGGAPDTPAADMTPGRVRGGDAMGGHNTGDAWGGYAGTVVVGPDGKPRYDESLSGRQADVDRFRAFGEKAAAQPAYQLNYGNANQDAAMGQSDRLRQQGATDLARDAALGHNSAAQAMGQFNLRQGGQMQQAGAMSTRGGPLAAASALQNQQGQQGAYMQRGNAALRANAADEMAAGRSQYADMAAVTRAGDAAAQRQNANQAINQGGMENAQRDLAQQGQMGFEGMAGGVNLAAQNAALGAKETAQGIDISSNARDAANKARDQALAVDASMATLKAMEGGAGGGTPPPTSDRRAKTIADFYGKRGH